MSQLQIREVRLNLGPFDGGFGACSHQTCVWGDALEVYVHDGSEDRDSFIHAKSAIVRLPRAERRGERREFLAYIEHLARWEKKVLARATPCTDPPPIPPLSIPVWRLNAWRQLHHYGQL
jgi:hypothetical protein